VAIAALMILGNIRIDTDVVYRVGHWLDRIGGASERRLLFCLTLCAALLGSVMSGTAVVAILIPVVPRLPRRARVHLARLLLPLSYAALISGMLTLIAAMPNIIVSEKLAFRGYGHFDFFSITPIGIVILLRAIVYFVLTGPRLQPVTAISLLKLT
jgi:di/tricarboxylate transporter